MVIGFTTTYASEWVIANSAIFQLYHFQWDNDELCFVLDQHTELDFYSASSLKQQSTDKHVTPLVHIIPTTSQPVLALSP